MWQKKLDDIRADKSDEMDEYERGFRLIREATGVANIVRNSVSLL